MLNHIKVKEGFKKFTIEELQMLKILITEEIKTRETCKGKFKGNQE